uniref:Vitamin K epoxide reductase complex, subunit 1 n=1 Tax=Sinocyclocheilus grahami TaxID=75366 RepID=A0A672RP48_SINGR
SRVASWRKTQRISFIVKFLSVYALHVELSRETNPEYRSMCDLGHSFWQFSYLYFQSVLNQPNSVLGIIFYTLQLGLGSLVSSRAVFFLGMSSWVPVTRSVYLAAILTFVLGDLKKKWWFVSSYIKLCTSLHKFTEKDGIGGTSEEREKRSGKS